MKHLEVTKPTGRPDLLSFTSEPTHLFTFNRHGLCDSDFITFTRRRMIQRVFYVVLYEFLIELKFLLPKQYFQVFSFNIFVEDIFVKITKTNREQFTLAVDISATNLVNPFSSTILYNISVNEKKKRFAQAHTHTHTPYGFYCFL